MFKWIKDNKIFLVAIILVAGIFLSLNLLFPLSGDDFVWATDDVTFSLLWEVNGRYLGVLFSLAITRHLWLRVIICVPIASGIIYFLSLAGDGKRAFFFIAAFAVFMIMPLSIYFQTVTWASGFANYAPSALVVLYILAVAKREFSSSEEPERGKAEPYIAAFAGFAGAFFLETVTIGNIIAAAALLIYHIIRFKKPSAALMALFAGAVAGAALMFVNPIYYKIADGSDPVGYRTINFSSIKTVYFKQFHEMFCYNNVWLNLVITALFTWLAVRKFPLLNARRKAAVVACFICRSAFLALSFSYYFNVYFLPVQGRWEYVPGLFTFLFCASILCDVLLLVEGTCGKLKFIFTICAILVYNAPLLVVTPLSPRTFFMAYILFAYLAVSLLNENVRSAASPRGKSVVMALGGVCLAACVAVNAFYICEYARIHADFVEREKSIERQLNEGSDTVVIETIRVTETVFGRNLEFVWMPEAALDVSYDTAKAFYNIPDGVELVMVEK